MTLEKYYQELEQIMIPEGLSWEEEDAYYLRKVEELRSQLSQDDLDIVLENTRRFQRKMQSSGL